MLERICIRNYRLFREFDLEFADGVNLLVGDNDTGKSTLVEAINLALTGKLNGRPFGFELSPYLVNLEATNEYAEQLLSDPSATPPEITIDLFLKAAPENEILRGTDNIRNEDCCGVRLQAKLAAEFHEEYKQFIDEPAEVKLAPTEYYKVEWIGFSGNHITRRSVSASASVIDPSSIRLQSGVDYHLQQIISNHLEPRERVELSRQYRSLRETFTDNPSVRAVNDKLRGENGELTDRDLSLSIDISQRYTWESSLVAHLNDLPFQFVGTGEQSAVKTLLALGRRADDVHVVLIEEPETHLSFASLRRLMDRIETMCEGKQVILATHSAYVLNKLGLGNLILISEGDAHTRITDLPPNTIEFFRKLPGYDTLRLVLSKGAFLVEGPSDELVLQRAYRDAHDGRMPIDDGLDVISVGTSHKRFLDIATRLNRRAWVIVDNDGEEASDIERRFTDYKDHAQVSLHFGADPAVRTLEPQIAAVNTVKTLNTVFSKEFTSVDAATEWMLNNKTAAALAIFESDTTITMPEYIQDAVGP